MQARRRPISSTRRDHPRGFARTDVPGATKTPRYTLGLFGPAVLNAPVQLPGDQMPEILTESFCERCGTRYTFESAAPRVKPLRGLKVLGRGLKNFVLSDDSSVGEAMAAARSDADRAVTTQQLDAFHTTFNFCMSCRQYTCANCWNEAEGRCLTCSPQLGREIMPAPFPTLAVNGPMGAIAEPPAGPAGVVDGPTAWPEFDMNAVPEPETVEATDLEVEEIDLSARLRSLDLADGAPSEPTAVAEPIEAEPEAVAEPIEAVAEIEAEPEAVAEPIEAVAEVEAEPEAVAEPIEAVAEIEAEPEAVAEPIEAVAEIEAEPEAVAEPIEAVAEVEAEPEAVAEPIEAVAEVEAEPEAVAEPIEAVAEVEAEPEAVAEPIEAEPEAVAEPIEAEPEAVAEPIEAEPEAVAEPIEAEPESMLSRAVERSQRLRLSGSLSLTTSTASQSPRPSRSTPRTTWRRSTFPPGCDRSI